MIFLTGATGFIGKALLQRLLPYYKVTCLVSNPKTFPLQHKNLTLVQGSLTNKQLIFAHTTKARCIIHTAALTDAAHPDITAVNVTGTQHLVEAAQLYNIKQFIFLSTENVNYHCTDKYTQSKHKAEQLVSKLANHTILREPIVYGPGDTKYVGKLISLIKRYPFVPLPGRGKTLLQPLYLDDLVTYVVTALKKHIFGTYTLVGKEPITYVTLVSTLLHYLGLRRPLIPVPFFILSFVAIVMSLLRLSPPLTRTQIANLKISREHDIRNVQQTFQHTPLTFAEGIQQMQSTESL